MIHFLARNAPALGALVLLVAPLAHSQATNPAMRGNNSTPRVAAEARAPLAISPSVASGLSPFSATCGDPTTAFINAEVEPHIAVNPANPSNMVGFWQQDRHSNGAARGVLAGVSFDGGASWSHRQIPWSTCSGGTYQRATDPWVAYSPDGTAYLMALAVSGESFTPSGVSAILVSRSTDSGLTWSNPITVIRDEGAEFFNDKETITADPTDSRFVYAVWDRLRQNVNGPTLFARTTDGGLTWEPARAIVTPSSGGQTIGNLIRVLPDGTLVNMYTSIVGSLNTIEVVRSTDRGVTWSAPIQVSPLNALGARDPHTGTPIRDGSILPQMAVGPDGALTIVWQDARFTGQRDAIAMTRSLDGGLHWSPPVRINPDPSVWAFTPQVHVAVDGVIGVLYYDLRSNTANTATLPTDTWLARSGDGGVNWTETRVADPFDLLFAPRAGGALFIGDYIGLDAAGTTFIPFFARTNASTVNRTDIVAARTGTSAAAALKRFGAADLDGAWYRAVPLAPVELPPGFLEDVAANVTRAMEARIPGWSRIRGGEPTGMR